MIQTEVEAFQDLSRFSIGKKKKKKKSDFQGNFFRPVIYFLGKRQK